MQAPVLARVLVACVLMGAVAAVDFPVLEEPFKCENPGIVANISLRQPFISADPQPVAWSMHAHSQKDDNYVSVSLFENDGNEMFEMFLKERIYKALRGVGHWYPRPQDPLFVDVGTNIGKCTCTQFKKILAMIIFFSFARHPLAFHCRSWHPHALFRAHAQES